MVKRCMVCIFCIRLFIRLVFICRFVASVAHFTLVMLVLIITVLAKCENVRSVDKFSQYDAFVVVVNFK